MVENAIHLSDAGFQCAEDGRVCKECDDWRDDELGLRKKRLEGTESVNIGRA